MVDREQKRSEEQADLKVTDRRLFTADGELRSDSVDEDVSSPEPAAERPQEPAFEHRSVEEPSGVDFTMLINAMAEPALLFLGEIQHPGS